MVSAIEARTGLSLSDGKQVGLQVIETEEKEEEFNKTGVYSIDVFVVLDDGSMSFSTSMSPVGYGGKYHQLQTRKIHINFKLLH